MYTYKLQSSGIPYLTHVWNVTSGCTKCTPACKNCYAEDLHNKRHQAYLAGKDIKAKCYHEPFDIIQLHEDRLEAPLRHKKPATIGVCFMSDLFHEAISREFLAKVFSIMARCPQHTFVLLSKRARGMAEFFSEYVQTVPSNILVGTTVWDQASLSDNLFWLFQIQAKRLFISYEPALAGIDLTNVAMTNADGVSWTWNVLSGAIDGEETPMKLSWVIAGGETGLDARPMHPDWAYKVRDDCQENKVPFYFKSWGEWIVPDEGMPFCRVCGCTQHNACETDMGGCYWAEPDLCSECVGKDAPEGDRPIKPWFVGKRRAGNELYGEYFEQMPHGMPQKEQSE